MGVSPHIDQSIKTNKILKTVTEILTAVKNQFVDFKKLIYEAFEDCDFENGQVSGACLHSLLNSFKSDIITKVADTIKELN